MNVTFDFVAITDFAAWLSDILSRREISQADLVRKTGLSPAQVSRILNGFSPAGVEACRAIAKELELSEVLIFQKAGLLSPQADYDLVYEEWRAVLHELNDANRDELLQIARLRLERQRKDAWSERFRHLSQGQLKELYQFMERQGWSQLDAPTGSQRLQKSK